MAPPQSMVASATCALRKLYHRLARPTYDGPYFALLIVFEVLLTTLIVMRVPYTEIDWVAYMEEVTTYQEGERNYMNIKGGTGPLVYPAGFLYLYGWIKSIAVAGNGGGSGDKEEGGRSGGGDYNDAIRIGGSTSTEAVRRVQWLFMVLYLANCIVVLALYRCILQRVRRQVAPCPRPLTATSAVVWSWRIAAAITCLSKRIHSIFVLRLFNDAPAMFLLHVSIYMFACRDAWFFGCLFFSLAVSIKMNVLLFAPGLLLLLLQSSRSIFGTVSRLAVCAAVQLVLGWPFLSTYPISYLKKAFELDRIFFFKWTVNWKFLPEDVFVSKKWALLLLAGHLGTLAWLARKWWRASVEQMGLERTRQWMCWFCTDDSKSHERRRMRLTPEYIMHTMFVSNYVGIVFARTLHYQFYSWYFYSLPMLHWMTFETNQEEAKKDTDMLSYTFPRVIQITMSVAAVFATEYAFNVFPASKESSALLQISHAYLLFKISRAKVPLIEIDGANKDEIGNESKKIQ